MAVGEQGMAVIQMPPPELCLGVGQLARPGAAFSSLLVIWIAARSRQERQQVPGRCFLSFCVGFWPKVDAMLFFFSPPALSKLGQARSSEDPRTAWSHYLGTVPWSPARRSLPRVSLPTLRPAVGYCGQPLPEKGRV